MNSGFIFVFIVYYVLVFYYIYISYTIILILYVPNLLTLDDIVVFNFIGSLQFLYHIPVHSLMLSNQLILGRPLPVFPSIFPSNSVLYMLFSLLCNEFCAYICIFYIELPSPKCHLKPNPY